MMTAVARMAVSAMTAPAVSAVAKMDAVITHAILVMTHATSMMTHAALEPR